MQREARTSIDDTASERDARDQDYSIAELLEARVSYTDPWYGTPIPRATTGANFWWSVGLSWVMSTIVDGFAAYAMAMHPCADWLSDDADRPSATVVRAQARPTTVDQACPSPHLMAQFEGRKIARQGDRGGLIGFLTKRRRQAHGDNGKFVTTFIGLDEFRNRTDG